MSTSTFDTDAMAAGADNPYAAATDLAEFLVERGMPFRSAHAVVGGLVRDALAGAGELTNLVGGHPDLGPDALPLLEPGASVRRRVSRGGGAPAAVADQLERFRALLDAQDARRDA